MVVGAARVAHCENKSGQGGFLAPRRPQGPQAVYFASRSGSIRFRVSGGLLCNDVQNPSVVWTIPHGAARVGPFFSVGPVRQSRSIAAVEHWRSPLRLAGGAPPLPFPPRAARLFHWALPVVDPARALAHAWSIRRMPFPVVSVRRTGLTRRGAAPSPKRRPHRHFPCAKATMYAHARHVRQSVRPCP